MKLRDITVEVRDKNLNRLGQIVPEVLNIRAEDRFNNVGDWTLVLPSEHPMVPVLKTPGAGIIITGPTDVIMSGPMVTPESAATPDNRKGTVTFSGVSDTVVLSDMLAYPEPSNADPTTQTQSHDTRFGKAETVMHDYVKYNCGPSAPVARRKANLTMGTNGMRGPDVTKSARFPVLGVLLSEIAAVADLGFRVVQRGNVLVFETYAITDRTDEIRLDVQNGTLAGHRVAVSPPGATRAIVAGSGELEDRTFKEVGSTDSLAAETAWGRRIERFVDQRNTDDDAELQQAGDELLAQEGLSALAIQAVPVESSSMPYGTAWTMGDRVTVVVDGEELSAPVTGMVLKADTGGLSVGAVIGDPTGFDPNAAAAGRVQAVENRVAFLEQNSENTAGLPARVTAAEVDIDALQALVAAMIGDSGWQNVTFANGWGNLGGGWQTMQYRKIGNQVHLRGLVAGGTINANIFTLPAGFRPGLMQMLDGPVNGKNVAFTASGSAGNVAPNSGLPDTNVTSTVSSHSHSLSNHRHSIGHDHPTVNVSGTATPADMSSRFRVDPSGQVFQEGGTHNGWIALWGSFFID